MEGIENNIPGENIWIVPVDKYFYFQINQNERSVSGSCKIMINLCQADLGIYTPEGMTGKIVTVMILKIATQTKNRYTETINSNMTSF